MAPAAATKRKRGAAAPKPEQEWTAEERAQRAARVRQRVQDAIEYLAVLDFAACAAILRVGRIEVLDPADAEPLGVSTAALIREQAAMGGFRIVLNARFCDLDGDAVAFIVLHELLHHVMRHLEGDRLGDDAQLSNIVEDAFINYAIFKMNPSLAAFPRIYYPADRPPLLFLRARSKPQADDDKRMYRSLYTGALTEEDLYRYLDRRRDGDDQGDARDGDSAAGCGDGAQESGQEDDNTGEGEGDGLGELELIGSHDDRLRAGENPLDVEQVPDVAREVSQTLKRAGRGAGAVAGRLDRMLEQFVAAQRLDGDDGVEELFRDALVDAVSADVIRDVVGDRRRRPQRRVVMPERIHRADQMLMSVGVQPLLWRHRRPDEARGKVVVYLDVSGSMGGLIEFVYGLVLAFEEYLHTSLYLFSNGIAEVTVDDLRAGRVRTTGGTDFDCVVEHLLELTDVDQAVLITDGYAKLRPDLAQGLARSGKRLSAAVTHGGDRRVLERFCLSPTGKPAVYELPADLTKR